VTIRITVPGEPVPWKAAKIVRRGKFAQGVSPDAMKDAQADVRFQAMRAMEGRELLQGQVTLYVGVYRTKGMPKSKVKRAQAEAGTLRPTTRPDLDNMVKLVSDSLNGIVYRDDSQIVGLTAAKMWSETPRVEIQVQEWTPC
jgi:Holliday junction resolvase RusA-like endonuclease